MFVWTETSAAKRRARCRSLDHYRTSSRTNGGDQQIETFSYCPAPCAPPKTPHSHDMACCSAVYARGRSATAHRAFSPRHCVGILLGGVHWKRNEDVDLCNWRRSADMPLLMRGPECPKDRRVVSSPLSPILSCSPLHMSFSEEVRSPELVQSDCALCSQARIEHMTTPL